MADKHLNEDLEEESEAIKTYGKRQRQHPSKASMYSEMQEDEKDHYKKLSQALKGLKRAHKK